MPRPTPGSVVATLQAREKELLKRHKKIWLGPIVNLVQSHALRFERGFLCTCFLEPNAKLEATLGSHPAWSTIREFYYHAYARETAKPLAAMLVPGQRCSRLVTGLAPRSRR